MNLRDMQWEEFRNDSGEEIPAFAVMRCTGGAIVDDGRVIISMEKPNAYGSQYMHYINGPMKVAANKFGLCTLSRGAPALYDSADGTPGFGEMWGPRTGTWKLKKNTGGFQVVYPANTTDFYVMVQQAPMLSFLGKTDASVVKSASVTVSIYAGTGAPGAETDTTVNMTSVYSRYGDIGSSKWVRCYFNGYNGTTPMYECIDAECT